ncbi:lipopolysaccharide transport periplasmic protein LptA [Lacimicrobium alkaliphilum]|uniref:Lipopolysaccharide export system protein LptA n=1 Tax=Lacimicrobium alkaliphilum TaxID=1526571 RepID=A0ABQ1QWR4_9ALTE|nr:lipopolysaccharide transport periplasmic protein LptA [Lacimicrobium alkaliphilum]GGD50223.1 lipopolysaccharide export system protein LptA [Lacimicrobium alkaliphilum]
MAKQVKFLILALLSFNAIAVNQDFDQPIKIKSEYQTADGIKKVSVFRENVNITQGSLEINADELEVDAGKGKGQETFIAKGTPASYEQTMKDGSRIRAAAEYIEYRVEGRILTLTGNAELHQNNHSVRGSSIEFNMEKEQLMAQGTDDGDGRVMTIFQTESTVKKQKTQQDEEQQD